MIQMPRRSITRYFIPLIDVMILLFCVFLLIPTIQESEPENPEAARKQTEAKKKVEHLEKLVKKLQVDIEALKKADKGRERPAMTIRTLEVDPKDGRLYCIVPGKGGQLFHREYLDEKEVQELVRRHRRELRQRYPDDLKRPELHYLIMTPRMDSAYPSQGQLEKYKQWFAGVSYSVDWPGGG